MANIFVILYIVLYIIPAFFWFFVVREYNKKAESRFPSLVFAILYLFPLAHFWLSWSFIKDIRELQIKRRVKNPVSLNKTYERMALPFFFMIVGRYLTVFLGLGFMLLNLYFIGNLFMDIAPFIPIVAFMALIFGFRFLTKTIRNI